MADVGSIIFNQKAAEKLRNPDDLDKYVRVTNPSVWIVIAACMALLAGLLAWGVFGTVSTSVSTTGVAVDGRVMCFLSAEEVAKVDAGDTAMVGNQKMTVSEVAAIPLSRDEVGTILTGDYLVSSIAKADWVYQVQFEGDRSE